MQSSNYSVFRSLPGVLVSLVALTLALYMLFRTKPANAEAPVGPRYDFIFGVYTSEPGLATRVTLSPYVMRGTLYLDVQRLPADAPPTNGWLKLYRYDSQIGLAVPLPSPSVSELENITSRQQLICEATKGLRLTPNDKSPDGYSLAEPGWVKVDPISNALGNVAMFLVSGGFGPIKKRENAPRLVKNDVSIPVKAKHPILQNETQSAFLLGWIEPDKQP